MRNRLNSKLRFVRSNSRLNDQTNTERYCNTLLLLWICGLGLDVALPQHKTYPEERENVTQYPPPGKRKGDSKQICISVWNPGIVNLWQEQGSVGLSVFVCRSILSQVTTQLSSKNPLRRDFWAAQPPKDLCR